MSFEEFDEDYDEDYDEDIDFDNERSTLVTERMKWLANGAKTLEDVVALLEGTVEYYKKLIAAGATLEENNNDDWLFVRFPDVETRKQFVTWS